jgi:hypothetical protein
MDSGICLLIFSILFFASLAMQFMRAKKRQKLVREFDQTLLSAHDLEKWNSINDSFDFMFKDFRKLQVIKKSRPRFASSFAVDFEHYSLFSRLEMIITASMLLFAFFGHNICK